MRVLVIDDEPDVILLCRVNLEFEGHQVLEAASGEEGLAIAERELPDVIVLDVMLPRQDGFSVLRRLHEQESTKDIPVVLLTAKAREDDQLRGWQMGADEYVTKPFSPLALAEAVARVGGMSSQEREARRRKRLHQLRLLHRL